LQELSVKSQDNEDDLPATFGHKHETHYNRSKILRFVKPDKGEFE